MSDEDPKSLLVLCDDIIRRMFSFMPIKSRVRHSGTCAALYQVMNESLLTVESLEDEDWFSGRVESKLKTLSKMKNLLTISAKLWSGHPLNQQIIDVMVSNCHFVERFGGFDMKCVDSYVTGLMETGVDVALKVVEMDKFDDEEDMQSVLSKTSVGLIVDRMTDKNSSRVMELYALTRYLPRPPDEHLLTKMTNVRKIGILFIEKANDLRRILDSLPKLTHVLVCSTTVHIDGDRDQLLRVLIDAKQTFTGLGFMVKHFHFHFAYDLEFWEISVQFDLLKELLQKRGPDLRSLRLGLMKFSPKDGDERDFLSLVSRFCPRLTHVHLIEPMPKDTDRQMIYKSRCLEVKGSGWDFNRLLTLFPKTKDVVTPYHWRCLTSILRTFADQKKKYCVNVYNCDPTDPSVHRFEGNLRVNSKRQEDLPTNETATGKKRRRMSV